MPKYIKIKLLKIKNKKENPSKPPEKNNTLLIKKIPTSHLKLEFRKEVTHLSNAGLQILYMVKNYL